jgi:hypothetical protein
LGDTFDHREEFAFWLLGQDFPIDFVEDYAKKASSSGVIWNEVPPRPERYEIKEDPSVDNLGYLLEASKWHGFDLFPPDARGINI